MSTMRRALLSEQGRVFCFLFLILCIPVTEKDDGIPKYLTNRRFFCKQPDSYENSGPPFTLESFVAKDLPSPAEPDQTLNKTVWALKVGKEVWHGELVDTHQTESASISYSSQEVADQWSRADNSSNSLQAFLNSATVKESKVGKCIPVIRCNANNSDGDLTEHNHSTWKARFSASRLQSLTSTLAGEDLPDKVQVLLHPTPRTSSPMAFHIHKQCSWPYEGHASSTVLSFSEGNRVLQTLELNFNSSLFPALKQSTLREHVNTLLDERITESTCNQGMSRQFIAKNMRSLPLQVHSLMIKGMKGEMHGFKVEYFGDFYLGPSQSTRLHVSYWPDLKRGITDGELQLVTSAGTISVVLKANVPKHIQYFCQNAALMARAKRLILQVCSLALFLVLLVFGKMLKQEGLIMSDVGQWSTTSTAAKLSERAAGSSVRYHDHKRSSIYVSIDIGCTQNESKQNLSLTKALDIVHAAINCMVGLKFLYISHPLNAPQAESNITRKSNLELSTQHSNDSATSTSNMTGKRRGSVHLRTCSKSASTNSSNTAAMPLRSKVCSVKNSKAIPQLDVTRTLEKIEPESPSSAHSDKEKEKAKQRKKKKGVPSLSPSTDVGSDSGSSSPLSMPSSPVRREALCRPVSPSCSGSPSSIQKYIFPAKMDASMTIFFDKDGSQEIQAQSSLNSSLSSADNCSLQATENNFAYENLQANNVPEAYFGNFPTSLHPEGKTLEVKSFRKLSERNLVKLEAVRNSSKGTATARVKAATLTTSATFPAPGQRSLQESICMGHGDGQNRPIFWSSSSSDLVSTSAVAPHARAPGSPLSPKSPSFSRNTIPSSLFTAPVSSRQNMQHVNPVSTIRGSRRGESNGKLRRTPEMFYYSGYERNGPLQMHEPHYAQKRQDLHYGSDSVLLYDMWGDHFADLGRRWGPYWTGKDTHITRKPSSLPPLLQTPPFSVFCNDPFNR